VQSNEEIFTSPIPTSHTTETHGRLEAWFKGHKEKIQVFLIKITRKQIIIPKVLCFSLLRVESFGALQQKQRTHKLEAFLVLSGKIYPYLVKVLYANL